MLKGLRKLSQRTLAVVLALLLAASGSVMAENAATGESGGSGPAVIASFADVNPGHWAEKFISKLALLDVVSGDTSGNYNPSSDVTKEEVAIMAVRLLGLQDEIDTAGDYALKLIISPWAKPYVVKAIDEHWIDLQEEMDGYDPLTSWGKSKASREWVAKLVVRALGKEADARALGLMTTSFTDDSDISANARGYINEAVNLGIIKGKDDGNGGMAFAPKGNITRAEIAVMFGMAEELLAQRSERIVNGTLMELGSQSVTLLTADGTTKTYSLSPEVKFFSGKTNKRVNSWEIGSNEQVSVIQIDDMAYYVESTGNQAAYEDITGQVVSTDGGLLKLTVDGQDKIYTLSNATLIVDRNGSGMNLSDLLAGMTVTISKMPGDASNPVVKITVQDDAPVVATVTGTIQAIDLNDSKIEVKDASTGAVNWYALPTGLPIAYHDSAITIGDLHIGDQVTVQTTDGAVTSFSVDNSSVLIYEGKINSVDADGKTIMLNLGNNELKGFFTIDDVKVVIDGLTNASLLDIQKDDEVTVEVDGNNMARKITVKNREVEVARNAVIVLPYKADFGQTILAIGKELQTFNVTDRTLLEYNGMRVDLKDFATYFPVDKKVDITYSGDQLISLRVTNFYDGVLEEINTLQKTIKLASENYGDITLNYNFLAINVFGKTSGSFSDLKTGAQIRVFLDQDQGNVIGVYLKQDRFFKVTGKYTNNSKLYAEDPAGTSYLLSVSPTATISSADGALTYNDLAAGQIIVAGFVGNTAESIYVTKTTIGKVTAVDPANNQLTINGYDGLSKTVTMQKPPVVVSGNTQSSGLALVAVNDRIQLSEGRNGQTLVQKIPGVSKKFFRYEAQSNTIQFLHSYVNETYIYDLSTNVYVHQGDQNI
ncbi:MAG TPA: S-layer homology domain-containing protein, partial [Bacilli bacterium]